MSVAIKKLVRCTQSKGSKVVDHTIGATFHKCSVLIWANSLNDVSFGNIENDASSELEEHLKESDGSNTGPKFLAEGLNLSNKPEIGNMLRNATLSPGQHPESGSLYPVRSFKEGGNVRVACLGTPGMR